MYRCPLSIKYKNLLIYSEVTIIFHWEIYLVLIHIQTGGRQIVLVKCYISSRLHLASKAQLHPA